MAKAKLDILARGGKIYYTDSLVTDIPLSPDLIGKDIGLFRFEYRAKRSYFISGKTYCLVLIDETTLIKAKGVWHDNKKDAPTTDIIKIKGDKIPKYLT